MTAFSTLQSLRDYLASYGGFANPQAATALASVAGAESGGIPTNVNSIGATGLFQWLFPSRLAGVTQFLGGDFTNVAGQGQYAANELNSGAFPGVLSVLNNPASTMRQMQGAIITGFENPGGSLANPASPAGGDLVRATSWANMLGTSPVDTSNIASTGFPSSWSTATLADQNAAPALASPGWGGVTYDANALNYSGGSPDGLGAGSLGGGSSYDVLSGGAGATSTLPSAGFWSNNNAYWPAAWGTDQFGNVPTAVGGIDYSTSLGSSPFSMNNGALATGADYGSLTGSNPYGGLTDNTSPFNLSGGVDTSGGSINSSGDFLPSNYQAPYGGVDSSLALSSGSASNYWSSSPFSSDASNPYGNLASGDQSVIPNSNNPFSTPADSFNSSSGSVMPSSGLAGGDQTGVGAMTNPAQPYTSPAVSSGLQGKVTGDWESTGAKAVSEAGAAVSKATTESTNKAVQAGTSWLSDIFTHTSDYFVRFGVLVLGLIFLAGGVAWFSRQEA